MKNSNFLWSEDVGGWANSLVVAATSCIISIFAPLESYPFYYVPTSTRLLSAKWKRSRREKKNNSYAHPIQYHANSGIEIISAQMKIKQQFSNLYKIFILIFIHIHIIFIFIHIMCSCEIRKYPSIKIDWFGPLIYVKWNQLSLICTLNDVQWLFLGK